MNRFMTYGFCLMLASPAFAQSVGEKTGVNAVTGITPSTQDFVTEAAQSDMFEIQSSTLALATADAPTKKFAQQMIADHTKTTNELKAALSGGTLHATLPTAMSSSQQSMYNILKGLHGADFTSHYHTDQVTAHKDSVSLYQRYSSGGSNPTLKSWAAKTLPVLQQHLTMAEDLSK